MLAHAPPYHGRISETLSRYAVIQSSGKAFVLPSSSTPPPAAQSHIHPGISYPKRGLARSPIPFLARAALLLYWVPPWRVGLSFASFWSMLLHDQCGCFCLHLVPIARPDITRLP